MKHNPLDTKDDPGEILGVSLDADDAEIRAAYLRKVKQFPPDRCGEQFEKIRDAYETLRDPRRRTHLMLLSADPQAPLTALLEGQEDDRRFVGPDPWLAVLREI